MRPRNVIVVLVVLLAVAGILWMLPRFATRTPPAKSVQAAPTPVVAPQAASTPVVTVQATPMPKISMASIPAKIQQQPGGPYQPTDPRWAERSRRLKEDPQYEWKTPIEFYGKVLDQSGNPVPGAIADVVWTNMSPDGSSQMQVTSDGAGLFSITGISGKHMTVQVTKEGYYRETSRGRSSYEYTSFWEPTYHEPDPNEPVIFYLRKRGEPAPLVSAEGKFVLTFGTPSPIPMPQAAGTASSVKVTVFENDPKTRKWKGQISVEGGGIQPALEEFPFDAPKEGYQPSIDLNQESPHPPGWQDIDEGGLFYIKTAQGYGLLKLHQMRGKKTLHYEILLNSTGGTNLEPAQR
jgi:hypothetical protein